MARHASARLNIQNEAAGQQRSATHKLRNIALSAGTYLGERPLPSRDTQGFCERFERCGLPVGRDAVIVHADSYKQTYIHRQQ